MDCLCLFGWNFGYCWKLISSFNILKIYWITSACYEYNLLYGDSIVWVVTIVMHIVLVVFLYLQLVYILLWSFMKKSLCRSLVLNLFCLLIHFISGNAPIWGQYTNLDYHGGTNTGSMWILHMQPHILQCVQLYYWYIQSTALFSIGQMICGWGVTDK